MTKKTSPLSSKQRARLRALSHNARPAVHIGKEGVTDASARVVEEAFSHEELLKVKVLEAAPATAREVAQDLANRVESVEVVQVLGRVVTLYRRHPEKPKIALPR